MRVRVYVTFVPPKKRKWRKLKKKQNKKKHFIFLAARERSFPHFSSNKNFAAGHLQIFLFGWQAVHFFPRYRKIGKSESARQSLFFFPCFLFLVFVLSPFHFFFIFPFSRAIIWNVSDINIHGRTTKRGSEKAEFIQNDISCTDATTWDDDDD